MPSKIDQRPTSSNHIQNCNGIVKPNSYLHQKDGLASTIVSDSPAPVKALVQRVQYGVPNQYPVVSRAATNPATETATLKITKGENGIIITLSKANLTTRHTDRVATFKLIEGGEFDLEAMVYRVTRSFEMFKFSHVANKHDVFWEFSLVDVDKHIDHAKRFWVTLCHHFQNSSVQKLSYVNLPRSQKLLSANTHATISRSKRNDDTDEQRALVINVPFEKHPWVFTKKLADPEFLKIREALKRGEGTAFDPDEEGADESAESSKAARSEKPRPVRKQKAKRLRRHARRVAAGLTSP